MLVQLLILVCSLFCPEFQNMGRADKAPFEEMARKSKAEVDAAQRKKRREMEELWAQNLKYLYIVNLFWITCINNYQSYSNTLVLCIQQWAEKTWEGEEAEGVWESQRSVNWLFDSGHGTIRQSELCCHEDHQYLGNTRPRRHRSDDLHSEWTDNCSVQYVPRHEEKLFYSN